MPEPVMCSAECEFGTLSPFAESRWVACHLDRTEENWRGPGTPCPPDHHDAILAEARRRDPSLVTRKEVANTVDEVAINLSAEVDDPRFMPGAGIHDWVMHAIRSFASALKEEAPDA